MKTHPKIKIELTGLDKLLEAIIWILIIIHWVMVLYFYPKLPESIPIHFNAHGEVDGYGSPNTLFDLPIISTITIVGMSILCRFPHIFNFPMQITPENIERQYKNAIRLLRVLNLLIATLFVCITYEVIAVATNKHFVEIGWIMPVILVLIFVTLIVYFVKSK